MALFGKKSQPVAPTFTEWVSDAQALPEAKRLVVAESYDQVYELISETVDPDRFELIFHISDDLPYEWALDNLKAHPKDSLALTLAGTSAVRAGWRARTDKQATNVNREQFKSFHNWLGEAEKHLTLAAKAATKDPTPWVYLVIISRGLEKSRAEAEQAFANLVKRAPDHLEGHRQWLQYVCRKWFGSHDEMFAFARSVSDKAPVASPLHELLLGAHFERYADFRGAELAQERQAYFTLPTVRADTELAVARLGGLLQGVPDGRSIRARNHLAFQAWASRNAAAFDAAVPLMHGKLSPMPWNYYGAPVDVATKAWTTLHPSGRR